MSQSNDPVIRERHLGRTIAEYLEHYPNHMTGSGWVISLISYPLASVAMISYEVGPNLATLCHRCSNLKKARGRRWSCMTELLHEHHTRVRTPEGLAYVARTYGAERSDGIWEAWL